jgi:lysophospholipase L1-like esterase
LLHGATLTSNDMLIDGIHLGIDGAAANAARLAAVLANVHRQHRRAPS